MAEMKRKKEESKTDKDFKLTGRALFEQKDTKLMSKLEVEVEDETPEGIIDQGDDEDDREAVYYDKALYAEEVGEEVDFD